MKKETLFLRKNTHHTIQCKKKYLSKDFLFSSTISVFYFTFEVEGILFVLMESCLHKKFQTK